MRNMTKQEWKQSCHDLRKALATRQTVGKFQMQNQGGNPTVYNSIYGNVIAREKVNRNGRRVLIYRRNSIYADILSKQNGIYNRTRVTYVTRKTNPTLR